MNPTAPLTPAASLASPVPARRAQVVIRTPEEATAVVVSLAGHLDFHTGSAFCHLWRSAIQPEFDPLQHLEQAGFAVAQEIIHRGGERALLASLASQNADLDRQEAEREPTDAEVADACLSYRHDFGLLSADEQERLRYQSRHWLRVWRRTFAEGSASVRREREQVAAEAAIALEVACDVAVATGKFPPGGRVKARYEESAREDARRWRQVWEEACPERTGGDGAVADVWRIPTLPSAAACSWAAAAWRRLTDAGVAAHPEVTGDFALHWLRAWRWRAFGQPTEPVKPPAPKPAVVAVAADPGEQTRAYALAPAVFEDVARALGVLSADGRPDASYKAVARQEAMWWWEAWQEVLPTRLPGSTAFALWSGDESGAADDDARRACEAWRRRGNGAVALVEVSAARAKRWLAAWRQRLQGEEEKTPLVVPVATANKEFPHRMALDAARFAVLNGEFPRKDEEMLIGAAKGWYFAWVDTHSGFEGQGTGLSVEDQLDMAIVAYHANVEPSVPAFFRDHHRSQAAAWREGWRRALRGEGWWLQLIEGIEDDVARCAEAGLGENVRSGWWPDDLHTLPGLSVFLRHCAVAAGVGAQRDGDLHGFFVDVPAHDPAGGPWGLRRLSESSTVAALRARLDGIAGRPLELTLRELPAPVVVPPAPAPAPEREHGGLSLRSASGRTWAQLVEGLTAQGRAMLEACLGERHFAEPPRWDEKAAAWRMNTLPVHAPEPGRQIANQELDFAEGALFALLGEAVDFHALASLQEGREIFVTGNAAAAWRLLARLHALGRPALGMVHAKMGFGKARSLVMDDDDSVLVVEFPRAALVVSGAREWTLAGLCEFLDVFWLEAELCRAAGRHIRLDVRLEDLSALGVSSPPHG